MADLSSYFCGVYFKNPIIAASGTFGFGREYENFYELETFGGISVKGLTLNERQGNLSPRICETSSGILNSVGLQNPGVKMFIKNELPYLKTKNTVIIANLAGATTEDYVTASQLLNDSDIDIVELNISCPNVKEGGVSFGVSCNSAFNITKEVKKVLKNKPLVVKLTPNVTDIASIAKSCEDAGADAISLINTLTGMRIDINKKRPMLRNNFGGLSGPCVFPIALRMVYLVSKAVKVPVIGMGGVSCANDAIEMIMAGASLVQVGTMLFNDPYTHIKINNSLNEFMNDNGFNNLNDIIGTVKLF